VIEEKASKVLEVLLASASTESLLIGKVLGVAAVLSTVGLIWGAASFAMISQGASFLPPDIAHTIQQGLAGLFTPAYVTLLLAYFIGGYLMFGVTFAAIGAFCETQKDAQAIMGPLMIVLMVPMLTMQAAIGAPNAPVIQWLSWVPIFTPFLMPLRLSEPLPLWEIVLTLGGMVVAATIMIAVGRRAFKQGALTGGKLTWGTIVRIATRKSTEA
jgi:ABC-2 type transport system permease protein